MLFCLYDQWSEISDDYLGSVGQPIRLDITVLDDSLYLQYNFYDFDTGHPDISVYDIHQCNNEGNWKHFTVQFPGTFHPYLDTSSRMFQLESLFRLSNAANVSIIRLQRLQLYHDDLNIYLSLSLAEKHKTSLYFTKVPVSYVPEHVDDEIATAVDEEGCANACLDDTKFQCNSFYYCKQTQQCLLSKKHVPDGPGQMVVNGCFSYSRTVADVGIPVSSAYAFRLLKNSVYSGNITVNIPIPETDLTKDYIAAGVTEQFTNLVTRSEEENALTEFTFVSNHTSFVRENAKILQSLSIDECALACTDEGSFNCNAFSYTFDTQLCLTVHEFGTGNMNNTYNSTVPSYLYIRKASKLYIMSPGTTSQGLADSVLMMINSDDDCAQLCTSNSAFVCRVFQYCDDTKQCLLFKDRTIVPTNKSQITSTCYQYSSKQLTDFIATNAGLFIFKHVHNIQMVTLSDCANLCIQEMGNMCKGFYFSANTLSCYLTSAVPGDSSSTVQSSPNAGEFCDVYTRTYFPPSATAVYPTQSSSITSKLDDPTKQSSLPSHADPVKSSVTSQQSSSSSDPTPTSAVVTPVTCIPPSLQSSTVLHPSSTGSSIKSTTNQVYVNTMAQQTGDNSAVSSGLAAGIALITFAVGILTGLLALHIYRRTKGLDELKTNFIEHEEI